MKRQFPWRERDEPRKRCEMTEMSRDGFCQAHQIASHSIETSAPSLPGHSLKPLNHELSIKWGFKQCICATVNTCVLWGMVIHPMPWESKGNGHTLSRDNRVTWPGHILRYFWTWTLSIYLSVYLSIYLSIYPFFRVIQQGNSWLNQVNPPTDPTWFCVCNNVVSLGKWGKRLRCDWMCINLYGIL